MKRRLLIIRFSSFGDILQALSVPPAFLDVYPDTEIHWLVRADFADIVSLSPFVHKVWSFERSTGIKGLLQLGKELNQQNFTNVYDAHNNLRSNILTKVLNSPNFARRSKDRLKRFLQFRMGIKQFSTPYVGQLSFLTPLKKWGIESKVVLRPLIQNPKIDLEKLNLKEPYVTIAPSAAWEMKRWPINHWKNLISQISQNVVLLGGPSDGFIDDLKAPNVISLSGRLSLRESIGVIAKSQCLVSGDTGLLHAADALHVPSAALIGPTAFGYPSQPTSRTLEVQLYCKPCSKDGRGNCKNQVYQKCMRDILPSRVLSVLKEFGVL